MSFVTSTSSSAITRISMPSTDITSPRSISASSTGIPFGWWIRSTSVSPSQALTSHSSGGSSKRMPASSQRVDRALDVLGLDHEVEVVARLRAAARPAREAAAEQERDVGAAQRGGGLLQRVLEVGEGLLSSVAM